MAKQPTPQNLTKKHLARMERERIQKRNLLIIAGIIGAIIFGLILYGILDQYVFTQIRPVARVGSENITTNEFQKQVRFSRYRLIDQLRSLTADPMMLQFFGSYAQQIQAQLASPSAVGQEVLDMMIENAIVRKEAERLGITVSREDLDREMEQAFGFFPDGTPTPTTAPTLIPTSTLSAEQLAMIPPTETPQPEDEAVPTEEETPIAETTSTPDPEATATPDVVPTETLVPTITPTPTPYSRELFEQNLNQYVSSAQSVQFNEQDLREFIRMQLLRRLVFEEVTKNVSATAEQVWARHILVATEEEAQAVLVRLQAGESFVDLARELSLDDSNKDRGGDLDWFTRDAMVTPFADAAFNMQVGEISQPIQTDFGYHIIQVLGHEERSLDPSQLEQARAAAYQTWLEQAKQEANVETYDRWISVVPSDPRVPPELNVDLMQ
jgi:peptidyl-prolyl cis-trans isomerase D